ncbi:hypothetical protein Fmac_033025 [Flemingia macrophylla]|uniref:Uncharacterized protein n=1 Tax=Flemingia macrophylla TaxID=520843 RepID=A0ABD1L6L0_9FABA
MFLRVRKQFESKHFSKTVSRGAKTCPTSSLGNQLDQKRGRGCRWPNLARWSFAPKLSQHVSKVQALFQNLVLGCQNVPGAPLGNQFGKNVPEGVGGQISPGGVSPPNSPNMFLSVRKQFESKHFSKIASQGAKTCPARPSATNLAKNVAGATNLAKNVAGGAGGQISPGGVSSPNYPNIFLRVIKQFESKHYSKPACRGAKRWPGAKFRPVEFRPQTLPTSFLCEDYNLSAATFPEKGPGLALGDQCPPWQASWPKTWSGVSWPKYRSLEFHPKLSPYHCYARATCFVSGGLKENILGDLEIFLGWVGGTNRSYEAESQWIVAARPLCHLQYPVAYLSRLQRIIPVARWELRFKVSRRASLAGKARQRHVPLEDVPPQPNSPPDNVFRPDRPAEAGLGSKKRGSAPLPIHGIIGLESSSTGSSFPADSAKLIPLAVVSLDSRQGQWESLGFPLSVLVLSRLFDAREGGPEGPVPRPARDDPLLPRKQLGQSTDSRRVRDWDPRAQPSEPILFPRPDAVMSTTGRGRHSVLRIFNGRRGRTGHHATYGALPAARPYLRLSRF